MNDNLVIAKKDRAVIRTAVDKYVKEIQDSLENQDIDLLELEVTLEQLNEASLELKQIDSNIKNLVKDNQLDAELQSAQEYREKIIAWRFKANKKLKELNQKPENNKNLSNENFESKNETIQIKLPKLEITKFSGNCSEWLNFWSCFENAIHENKNLAPVDKFGYLKSYLTGDALRTIEGFAITSENYFKCIDLLTERFGKNEILIDTHMNILLNLSPVKSSNDVKSLRKLYDKIQVQIRSLETLDVNLKSYGQLLSPIILKLLPKDLVLDFHKENINKAFTVNDVLNFLYIQLNARERFQQQNESPNTDQIKNYSGGKNYKPGNSLSRHSSPPNTDNRQHCTAANLLVKSKVENTNQNCSFCNNRFHDSNACPEIKNLSFEEKLNILRKKGICFRCLKVSKPKHIGKFCNSKIFCSFCNGKHASIMCNRKMDKDVSENENNISKQTLSNGNKSSNVYLLTLIAEIKGDESSALIRIIIDLGSENTYISKYVADKLNLRKIKTEKIKHGLFGGIEMTEEHSRYKFLLSSFDKNFHFEMEALDQNKICTGVNYVSDKKLIKSLERENVFLSDVYENRNLCLFEDNPEEIHLLVGVDMASHLFTQNIKNLPKLGLSAFQTRLGWVIMGKTKDERKNNVNINDSIASLSLSLHVSSLNLADLWRLDTLGISDEENKTKADLEEETQKYFFETVKRDISGRFEVSLPWIVEPSVLPSNRAIAENAVYKTEKKLNAAKTRKEYSEIFDFWNTNEIIEEVTDEKKDRVHFLPHRPVVKETSATTKIRPVFNASAHTRNSPSLNDCLTKGPNLIEIIPRIFNRFRKYRIGISSDIEKAFLQIKITEKDRDFLRFFWFDKDNNLKVYRHCRVVFGLTSSPFLLVATLKYLLSKVEPPLTETAQILERSFYIDNSLTSLNSEQETKKFMKESIAILASGHFNLRCWTSNSPIVMKEELENRSKFTPVLGLNWDTETDSLMCRLDDKFKIEEPYTKRKILSIVQKVFDPIGFTAPVILIPKLVLQMTWIQKLKWDEKLPENLKKQFNNWVKDIGLLSEVKIPRWLNIESINENKATLHIFCDASKTAYATCAFIRVETPEGIKIQLVNARNRVSPIKELTIPRLELLSCLIGARLAKTVSLDLELPDIQTTFWSDSTTALGWIRREQSWGTYVHNRVSEIRKLSNVSDWKHIPGTLNPADLPSRGCSFEQLKLSKWWEGPSWLYSPEDAWPHAEDPPDEDLINREKRKTVLTLLDKNNDTDWYYKHFSSYRKLVRMMAWILRFLTNLKNKEKTLSPNISAEEFVGAEKTIFKLIQKESFTGETDPKIRSLRPLEDKDQIIRVKTNLINRKDTETFRYPVLLPSQHPVVRRLIFEKHIENQHAGVGVLMTILREDYWILKSRKTIRNEIRKCVRCKRFEINRIDVEQGIPPEDRVRDAAIFEIVGTDLAGPLYLSDGAKAWIVLFTCAIYRAVHLELVASLSTDSFIQSLRRFIARRGRPRVIYSDNGTNYIGTANALSSLDWTRITSEASVQKIRWRFNPPAAPWWGGWWERLVRLVKENLRKSLGRASFNYEELNTILCDIENIINSRPITYVSEDSNDLNPLTPRMFLQELPSSGTPDLDILDSEALNRRARYRQKIRNELRKRFRNEYLGQLRHHYQNKANIKQLQVGDIVLLEDPSGKRINWPLAKVTHLLPGKDGIVRLARIQTQNGTFLRPLQRLFPLEIGSSIANNIRQDIQTEISSENDPSPRDRSPVHPVDTVPPVVTRCGRIVNKPQKFQP